METQMDQVFAAAVRAELISRVIEIRKPRRRRLWLGVGVAVGFGVLAGGGIATAAGIWGVPGSQQVTTLTAPTHVVETGTATVPLAAAPTRTTDIHLELVCLSPGTLVFPDGASVSCAATDVGTRSAIATYDMAAKPGQTSTTITTASATTKWSLTATWVTSTTTKWGTNSRGQTYGVQNSNGTPDLIAVEATNGKVGYVFAKQLADADGDTAARHFTSPAEALAWQKAHEGKTSSIPVFESDGTTKIGVFTVGG
ncbi:MAG: hypothetical protein QOH44_202 [Actinomycetota bacterium]|nr:hypothetical protein [Actinomycetota bacterium]